jgi:hypothetical protein
MRLQLQRTKTWPVQRRDDGAAGEVAGAGVDVPGRTGGRRNPASKHRNPLRAKARTKADETV